MKTELEYAKTETTTIETETSIETTTVREYLRLGTILDLADRLALESPDDPRTWGRVLRLAAGFTLDGGP